MYRKPRKITQASDGIEGLDDVELDYSTLVSGQVLTYDATDQKFRNTTGSGGGGSTTFLGLVDTPSAFTTPNALYTVNGSNTAIEEKTTTLEEGTDQFSINQGATNLVVTQDCDIDQNLSTTSDVTHNSLTLVNTVSQFDTDNFLTADSDVRVPTQAAVKDYSDRPHLESTAPHGILPSAIATMTRTYDNTTRTLTITNSSYPYQVYVQGVRFEVTGSVTSTHGDIEGVWIYAFYNNSGTLGITPIYFTTITNNYQYLPYVPIAQLYWSSSSGVFGGIDDGLPVIIDTLITSSITETIILNRKLPATTKSVSCGVLTDFQLDGTGSDAADLQFRCSDNCLVYGGSIEADIDERLKTAELTIAWYEWNPLVGANLVRFVRNATGKAVHNAVAGRTYYNLLSAGQYSLVQVTSGNFVIYHVFSYGRLEGNTDQGYLVVMGQNVYSTLVAAEAAIPTEVGSLQLDETSARLFARVGSYIIQTSDSYTNDGKARIREFSTGASYLDTREFVIHSGSGGGTSSFSSDHGTLSGLGDDDHLQYAILDADRASAGSGNVSLTSQTLTATTEVVSNSITPYSGTIVDIDANTARINSGGTNGLLHVQGTADCRFWLESDTDNLTESDNPVIYMSQDGGAVMTRLQVNPTNGFDLINSSVGGTTTQNINIYHTGTHVNNGVGVLPADPTDLDQSILISGLNGNVTFYKSILMSTGATINEFSTDGTLGDNSNTALPTEQAVKTYVDALGGTVPADFLDLTDTPAAYGSAYSSLRLNSAANALEFSPLLDDTTTNQISLSSGTAALVATNTCNIDQSVTTTSDVDFGSATLTSGATINEFSTDTSLSGNSDTAVPTEKAVKTYVDAQIGASYQELNVAFVSKRGNDASDGLSPANALLTISAAMALAPSCIIVTDAGTYSEAITGTTGIDINAPRATLNLDTGNCTLINSTWIFDSITRTTNLYNISPSGTSNIVVNSVSLDGNSLTSMFYCASGYTSINVKNATIETDNILVNMDGATSVDVKFGNIILNTGIVGTAESGGKLTVRGGQVYSPTSTGIISYSGATSTGTSYYFIDYIGPITYIGYGLAGSATTSYITAGDYNGTPATGGPSTVYFTELDNMNTRNLTLTSGATINEFSTDGTLAGDSDVAVPTEQAVKTYVDTTFTTLSTGTFSTSITTSGYPWATAATVTLTGKKVGGIISITLPGNVDTYSITSTIIFPNGSVPSGFLPYREVNFSIKSIDGSSAVRSTATIGTAGSIVIKNDDEAAGQYTSGSCGYYSSSFTYI